ncbi:MAG: hypothetical protein IT266_08210 [Saprospiraceae bacterium]|nr:hypothetical protein [Saprospiraceae bacterium]
MSKHVEGLNLEKRTAFAILLAVLYFGIQGMAQPYRRVTFDQTAHQSMVLVEAREELGAEHVADGFFDGYIGGGKLSGELIGEAVQGLKTENLLGLRYGGSALLRLAWRGEGNYLLFGVGHERHVEAVFSKDLFQVYFQGNQAFEGKTALLHPLEFNRTDYSFAKVGFERQSTSYFLSGNLGLATGSQYRNLVTDRGSLFTAVYGREVELELALEDHSWDGNHSIVWNGEALGFLVDAEAGWKWSSGLIGAGIRNVGFIDWQNKVRNRVYDTVYSYTGIEISEVLDSFAFDLKGQDVIASDFAKTDVLTNVRTNIPGEWCVWIRQGFLDNRWLWTGAYGSYFADNARPFYSIRSTLYILPGLYAGASYGRGAYSLADLGLHAGILLGGRIGLHGHWDSIGHLLGKAGKLSRIGGVVCSISL